MLRTPGNSLRDAGRLRALRASGLCEAEAVPALDRLTTLAARMLHAPVALVTVVEPERQRFASAWGLTGELDERRETPISHSYCRYVVEDRAALIVPDARLDERLKHHPALTDHQAVAYAGFPLRSPDGHVLGSFCVVDSKARDWTTEELDTLRDLAAAAGSEVALRLAYAGEQLAGARMNAVLDGTQDAYIATDVDGRVVGWNRAAERMFGYAVGEVLGRILLELIIPERLREQQAEGMARMLEPGATMPADRHLRTTAVNRAGQEFPAEMTLQLVDEPDGKVLHAFVHDITGRMIAAAEMERQRRKLDEEHAFPEAVLDSLDVGVGACDSGGRLMFFNRALRDLIGDVDPAAPMQDWTRVYQVYEPDGRTVLKNSALRRAHAGEIVHGQQMLIRTRNEWRRFVSNARPIEAADGRRLGAVAAVHDITEAHRAEELRRAWHAVAQVLSDATNAQAAGSQAVARITESLGWLCGEYWQVTEDRQQIVRLSSHTAGDRDLSAFTGGHPLTFVRGEGLPGLVWMRNGEVWWNTDDMPADMVGPGRDTLHEVGIRIAIGVPVRSGRRTLGVLAFYIDKDMPYDSDTAGMLDAVAAHLGRFVERRWAEDMTLALAAARRSFDRVVEQVNDYVWTVEAVGGEPPRLVYGSPNATGVFGPMPAGSAPPTLSERLHPDDADVMVRFQETLADGEPAEMECRIIGYDGRVRWVWTRATSRLEDGRAFVDGISTDVTERRELAEQLLLVEREQVERLRELDRMKDELSAVVIHELRNPVGVIRGYTEMLLDSPTLTAVERRHAGVVERTTLHLQRLVDDLLHLARLDAGHLSIDPRPMPGDRLLRDVIDNHLPSAAAKHVTIETLIKPDLAVHADAQRLRQALDNLLSNAIKYTPEGGTVTVSAGHRDDAVLITISDTGIGIPAEQYQHLFSRFFRASNATRAGTKGTGLGLAVTKAIVDAHGGSLTACPAAGGGTEFTVVLPVPSLKL